MLKHIHLIDILKTAKDFITQYLITTHQHLSSKHTQKRKEKKDLIPKPKYNLSHFQK